MVDDHDDVTDSFALHYGFMARNTGRHVTAVDGDGFVRMRTCMSSATYEFTTIG